MGLEPKDVLDIAFKEQMHKVIEFKRQVAKDKVTNQLDFKFSFHFKLQTSKNVLGSPRQKKKLNNSKSL